MSRRFSFLKAGKHKGDAPRLVLLMNFWHPEFPEAHPTRTFAGWRAAMKEPNVRGLVAGRALVYPEDGDVEGAVTMAANIVHPNGGATA